MKKSREEHLDWCKNRAIELVNDGNLQEAYASMCSDLSKHPETMNHSAMELGLMLMVSGNLSTKDEMIKFIEGFN